ncbi:transcriptional regulator MntR [Virgibacillus sp. MSP4-1]|uniref:transcriptional regulator MntR n=1 Tax=Virgibacillus sp. MSP4-1 TaxID=2700081 RepID=UPI0003A5C6FF|nr:transcriptional regulator MntR [Virgibacillus sp. MSP4-1]QHS21942.1 transcriptional regulator MntR [Virgibacillus sp. MSP4-1]
MGGTTPSMEDYMEQIYLLIHRKGYARVSEIAENLSVQPSSVTKMVQKLGDDGYLVYERYRGLNLTTKGEKFGHLLVYRHDLLEEFLEIIGVHKDKIYDDVEGIEHHLSWEAIDKIANLVQYFKDDLSRVQVLQEINHENDSID